jgi:glycerophosphoryl diester phosphodiesterase
MKIFAHRGYSKLYTDNTLASFKAALVNSDGIECDIWMTQDQHWIIYHNNFHPKLGFITDNTLADIQVELPDLCLLTQLLDILSNKIPVFLELKETLSRTQVSQLLKVLAKYTKVDYYLGGFCARNLEYLSEHLPTDKLVYNMIDSTQPYLPTIPTKVLSISKSQLTSEFVQTNNHKSIWVYTVNDKYNYQRCLSLGVDVIITDDPTLSYLD